MEVDLIPNNDDAAHNNDDNFIKDLLQFLQLTSNLVSIRKQVFNTQDLVFSITSPEKLGNNNNIYLKNTFLTRNEIKLILEKMQFNDLIHSTVTRVTEMILRDIDYSNNKEKVKQFKDLFSTLKKFDRSSFFSFDTFKINIVKYLINIIDLDYFSYKKCDLSSFKFIYKLIWTIRDDTTVQINILEEVTLKLKKIYLSLKESPRDYYLTELINRFLKLVDIIFVNNFTGKCLTNLETLDNYAQSSQYKIKKTECLNNLTEILEKLLQFVPKIIQWYINKCLIYCK